MNLQSVRFIIFTNLISIDWKEDKTMNTFVSKYTYNTTMYLYIDTCLCYEKSNHFVHATTTLFDIILKLFKSVPNSGSVFAK